ncbi:nucleotide disphospho-sugar-binding domain-containing protein [Nocardioides sp.]|uniref:nucleotide disphospho-sugar-binding domain-containing protein n=1 Tax=Nocardioides sp. TaxID=35761 RepID=UPI0039C920B5
MPLSCAAAIQTCDLVVHHGGAGTSRTALGCGTPAVVLPLGGDQFRDAQLLATAGAAALPPRATPTISHRRSRPS